MAANLQAAARDRFEADRTAHWRQRDALLAQHRDRWVAIVDGEIVAVGDSSGEVIRAAHLATGSTCGYVAHMGHEDRVYRLRQVSVGRFQHGYVPPALMIQSRCVDATESGYSSSR